MAGAFHCVDQHAVLCRHRQDVGAPGSIFRLEALEDLLHGGIQRVGVGFVDAHCPAGGQQQCIGVVQGQIDLVYHEGLSDCSDQDRFVLGQQQCIGVVVGQFERFDCMVHGLGEDPGYYGVEEDRAFPCIVDRAEIDQAGQVGAVGVMCPAGIRIGLEHLSHPQIGLIGAIQPIRIYQEPHQASVGVDPVRGTLDRPLERLRSRTPLTVCLLAGSEQFE